MANAIKFKDKVFSVGDTIEIDYKFKEADGKERVQKFLGILLKIRGSDDNSRMITVRKVSKTGIGVERVIPLMSPNVSGIRLDKKSNFNKAKLYFVRGLSGQNLRRKLYKQK
ncbi:hypothetical protein A3F03_05015 [Candidatus Roizmanbacteria bacterium RIFCSPHIGHO2_12_FULL_41_11]|uniref:50S ribosomal protein L19 n=2 Tax=Candidatus Roizmaniibacteriota TaxID=1752723 RepID=A0A1F7JQX1_9BACT|nr:MAG: hypothetical protein A3F03_05015 [Candidatus Roizmanbacteria bacterium RIFCSPHIGHO2_12_FULL_41_11]OGK58014.1 MAG: hypothetical protein A3H86_03660 [Candidatus Roizmanbacteria bacterium RIFCSPLOWO2_02_FULL_41_9]